MSNKTNRKWIHAWKMICNHGLVLAKGFARVLYGAAVAGLIGMAVYGFAMISTEDGWTAVCDFIASTATMVIAMCGMYAIGSGKRKGGYER